MKKPSAEELALVERGYIFAEKAHSNHRRYSGEPYFNHLFETAKILAEFGMNGSTMVAGLLHDSIEDVGVKPETIKNEFGEEILMLVEGVTKLGHLHYRGVYRYSESMRRLFVSSSKDLRILIIKLADRLHNMRTLRFVPKEKQKRIAMETLEIYAPIAYRLGIRKINRELQDLSFPFAYPEQYSRVTALLAAKQSELEKRLTKFHRELLRELAEQKIKVITTSRRIKCLYSLYMKLIHKDWDIEKIHDMLAIRIIVETVEDCYQALGVIHSVWRPLPGRIKDYIAFPKPNGYRSIHTTVFSKDGGTVEIQIRTEEMHRESEYGVATHFVYKELTEKKVSEESYLNWAKRILTGLISWSAGRPADIQAPQNGDGAFADIPAWVRQLSDLDSVVEEQDFWERLRADAFKNRIFIFTPKGDVVDLPADSSPIDFAFAIHSDIGEHMIGAKVNGKLVGIDTPLKNGDIVEILTKQSAHVSPKWLSFTRTTLAKKHIKNALTRIKP